MPPSPFNRSLYVLSVFALLWFFFLPKTLEANAFWKNKIAVLSASASAVFNRQCSVHAYKNRLINTLLDKIRILSFKCSSVRYSRSFLPKFSAVWRRKSFSFCVVSSWAVCLSDSILDCSRASSSLCVSAALTCASASSYSIFSICFQDEKEETESFANSFKYSAMQWGGIIALSKGPFSIADAFQILNVQVDLHSEYDSSSWG